MGLGSAIGQIGGAVGSLFQVGGDAAAADSYTSAAQLEAQNSALTAASTRIQAYQEARTVTQSLGTTQADVAGAGFTESGSALDLLKSSAQQGALATSLVNIQGSITENSYAAEEGSDLAKAKAASEAGTAGTISAIASIGGAIVSGGELLASAASGTGPAAAAYNYITGLFTGGSATVASTVGAAGLADIASGASAATGVATGAAANAGAAAAAAAGGTSGSIPITSSLLDSSITSGAGLLGSLGAAGVGAGLGDLLAGALGENSTGGAVGGGIGAGVGAAVAGPLGAVIGGALGSIVGGLFGNSEPSDETEVGGIDLTTGAVNTVYETQESDTGSKYSSANAAVADNAQVGASNFAKFLLANGATPTANTTQYNPNLVIKVGSRDGLQVGTQNEAGGSNALDYTQNLPTSATPAQLMTAINQVVLAQYNIPAALQTQLQSMNLASFYSSSYTA